MLHPCSPPYLCLPAHTAPPQRCELTSQVLQTATVSLLQHMSRLRCLIDNIALLDMLCSCATVACMANEPYVRPKITQAGPIAIVNGRHVMLEHTEDAECQVAAPVHLNSSCQADSGPK